MHLIVPVAMIVFVAVVIFVLYNSKQRKDELGEWARRHGLTFEPWRNARLKDVFPGFQCLTDGDDCFGYNVMKGSPGGVSVTAFDYHLAPKSRTGDESYIFSALVAESPVPLKPMRVERREILDRKRPGQGLREVGPGDDEFSETFRVVAADPQWALEVLRPDMRQWLMSAPEFSVQFSARHVLIRSGGCFVANECQKAMELAQGVLARLPGAPAREPSPPEEAPSQRCEGS